MLKKIILYPFLFVLDIILIPLSVNLDQIDPSQVVRPLVVLLALSGAILVILALILRDWQYAGYLTFLILAFQFLFGHLWRSIQDQILSQSPTRLVLLGIWGVLLVLIGMPRVWKRLGGGGRVTPILNLLLGAVILSQVLFTLPEILRETARLVSASASTQPPGQPSNLQLDCSQRPDIYYVILDAYGRSDVLGDYYGVDNSAFLQSLRDMGFFVADRAHTNYIQTIFSVAAALNMEHIEPNPPQVSGQEYFTRLIAENELFHSLKECGYQTIAFESGFYFTDQPVVDVYLTRGSRLTEFENLLLADTPVGLLADRLGWMKQAQGYQAHRERVLFTFEQLGKLAGKPGPKFVFAHVLSPHPPFVFNAQGQPVEPPRSIRSETVMITGAVGRITGRVTPGR
jgi:hypothetical protein